MRETSRKRTGFGSCVLCDLRPRFYAFSARRCLIDITCWKFLAKRMDHVILRSTLSYQVLQQHCRRNSRLVIFQGGPLLLTSQPFDLFPTLAPLLGTGAAMYSLAGARDPRTTCHGDSA